ncbi:hypothetical protein MNBD_GAMMA06-1028 [hydrothermal vent metagenome]|uniref:Uncharacterized protein n=1 Tax=hydrothermal vent metagenome TaxID=652676 RepID=A0A3B0WIT4_9ZZZZ
MDDNRSTGQFSLPGIALVFVALGLFVFSENAFVPTRPDVSSELSSTAEGVRARLWQDPFEAVEAHKKSKHTTGIERQVQRLKSNVANQAMYQNQQHRICNPGLTIKAVKDFASFQKKDDIKHKEKMNKLAVDLIQSSAHSVDELRCQIQRKYGEKSSSNEGTDLHILAVMVSGGSYAENRETRLRSRYAAISALSTANYFPNDAESIGYIDFADLCNRSLEDYPLDFEYCDWPATMPYEWYVNTAVHGEDDTNRAENLLILWLNDEGIALQQPLKMLQRLRSALTVKGTEEATGSEKKNISIQFDVLGPASSTTLVKMYKEADMVCFKKNSTDCVTDEGDSEGEGDSNSNSNSNSKDEVGSENYIRILSPRATIGNAAINKKAHGAKAKDEGDKPARWLKIATESADDSTSGWFKLKRTIPTDNILVDALLCELLRRGINPYSEGGEYLEKKNCDHLFLEGFSDYFLVEGFKINKLQDYIVLVGESDTVYSRSFHELFSNKIKPATNNNNTPEWLLHYSYFRGIDGSTQEGDSKVSSKNNKSAEKDSLRRPVGEYQYDYLRRLGQQLSELSATLSKSNKGTIRAIGIIGSDTYDKLLVLQALRNKFPEAVFFTTDLDARMLHAEENQWARNLVVASGYGLAPKNNPGDSVIPFRDGYQTSLYLAMLTALNVENVEKLISQRASIFEIGNNAAIDYSGNKKYHYQNELWLYVFLLLMLFLLLMYQTSEKSRSYLISLSVVVIGVALWVGILDVERSTEYHQMFSGTSIWPSLIIRMSATLFSILFIFYALAVLKSNAKIIKEKFKLDEDKNTPNALVKFCISLWGCQYIRENGGEATSVDIRQLISQYFSIAQTSWWSIRVTLMMFVYMLLTGVFLFSFSDLPYIPYSDKASAIAQLSVFFISTPLYLFLIFFVVDVTRLNARFVTLVATCKILWPNEMLEEYCYRYGLSKKVASEKLKIDLIVLRSKAVDALIFLPFIILTMMIVSRTTYFDRWYMSIQLAIVFLLGACIALGSAIRLRRSAEMARGNALENLEDVFRQQLFEECKQEKKENSASDKKYFPVTKIKTDSEMCQVKMSERISRIIDEVKNLKQGPFAPIAQHPIVAAIAMPFGGVGSIYLIDYFSKLGV